MTLKVLFILLNNVTSNIHNPLKIKSIKKSKNGSKINHFTIPSALFQSALYVILMLLHRNRKCNIRHKLYMFLSLDFLSLVSLLDSSSVSFIVDVIYVKDNKNLLYVFRACLPGERTERTRTHFCFARGHNTCATTNFRVFC